MEEETVFEGAALRPGGQAGSVLRATRGQW
jgi:hypothetical protein